MSEEFIFALEVIGGICALGVACLAAWQNHKIVTSASQRDDAQENRLDDHDRRLEVLEEGGTASEVLERLARLEERTERLTRDVHELR